MARYRKKPVVIEAEQFWPDKKPYPEGVEVFIAEPHHPSLMPGEVDFAIVRTLEGNMRVSSGDWIIKGVKGEFYPCKPDIFEATYDLVEEADQ